MLDLGRFIVVRDGDSVWIRDVRSGEAGQFPLAEFEAVVKKYFSDRF